MTRFATTIAALAAAGFASVAIAEDEVTFEFDYTLAETASIADAERVYEDLERAARKACGSASRLTLRDRQIQEACAADLVAKAVSAIDAPSMTRVHVLEVGDETGARIALR